MCNVALVCNRLPKLIRPGLPWVDADESWETGTAHGVSAIVWTTVSDLAPDSQIILPRLTLSLTCFPFLVSPSRSILFWIVQVFVVFSAFVVFSLLRRRMWLVAVRLHRAVVTAGACCLSIQSLHLLVLCFLSTNKYWFLVDWLIDR